MKNPTTTCVLAALFTLAAGSAWAQEGSPPPFAPVEIYGCNYIDDNDSGDLDTVINRWNNWMDDNSQDNFTALTMVPYYYSADITTDVLWLGVWPDGASMGGGLDQWLSDSDGMEIEQDFADVLDCGGHSLYATLTIRPPAGPAELGPTGPIEFTNCSVHDGRTAGEALGAIREWVEFNEGNGADTAHWVLFLGPGQTADTDYNFKWVRGYPSQASYGRAFDQLTTARGFMTYGDLFSRLLTCDSPRVYLGNFVRLSPQDAE